MPSMKQSSVPADQKQIKKQDQFVLLVSKQQH